MVSRGLATALTSTTAAVCSNRFRRVQTNRPKQADRSQSATAHILSPVVPHQGSGPSKDSKLDPNAHQPHTKSEKGIATAVARSTGLTVRRRRNRNAGGRARAGMIRTKSNGRRGIIEGRLRGAPTGGCHQPTTANIVPTGLTSVEPQTKQSPTSTLSRDVSQRARYAESDESASLLSFKKAHLCTSSTPPSPNGRIVRDRPASEPALSFDRYFQVPIGVLGDLMLALPLHRPSRLQSPCRFPSRWKSSKAGRHSDGQSIPVSHAERLVASVEQIGECRQPYPNQVRFRPHWMRTGRRDSALSDAECPPLLRKRVHPGHHPYRECHRYLLLETEGCAEGMANGMSLEGGDGKEMPRVMSEKGRVRATTGREGGISGVSQGSRLYRPFIYSSPDVPVAERLGCRLESG